jgi:branched-chain amino acid transport system substrate-binding protein
MQSKLMTIAGAAALMLAGSAMAQEVVKIGHVAPLSGPSAHLGKDNEYGARMAIEELNAKGVTIGGKKVKLELQAEDDGSDPKQGTTVAQKLVDAKVKGVIGHLNSGTTVPASRIYSNAGIPQISPSSTLVEYTNQGFKTAFRVVTNDNQIGGALGRYATQSGKPVKIAVIDDRTAYGQGIAREFTKAAKAKPGVQIVATQFTTSTATDFNAILTNIKGKNPDLIFFGGMDSVGGPMLRQMKALGIKAKFMGGDGVCTEAMIRLSGDALVDDQVVCAEAGGVTDAERKNMDAFRANFKKRFNVDVQLYAPYVYDATMTMVDAMVQAGSSEPAKYLPVLAKIKHKGITGDIAFDAKGDIQNGALTLFTFRGGKKTQLAVVR